MRAIAGSSPLTRGKPRAGPRRRRASGLIPAHAGKTARVTRLHRHQRAHPRSRGENGFARLEGGGVRGSSPLTRGKPPPSGRYQAVPRLIPAHAGKTTPARCASEGPGAHPRSRGENCSSSTHTRSGRGSSPLTRGKRVDRRSPISCPRLIPAHAGKTVIVLDIVLPFAAHPRSRGENQSSNDQADTPLGSSPLTRGKRDTSVFVTQVIRLIPAHAGKTGRRESIIWLARAHPRSRGENGTRPSSSRR